MSAFDLNDAAPQSDFGDIIPNGAIVKLCGRLRPGGEGDEGLLKASQSSDAMMLDWEFTVVEGTYARRKFWSFMTVSGGNLNERGESKGWVITKSTLRAMVDSACGLNPKDESNEAKARRNIPGFGALDGIVFVAKIGVEKGQNGYADKNKIQTVITPDKKEWQTVWNGQEILPGAVSGGFGAPGGFGSPAGGFAAAPTQAPGFVAQPAAAPMTQPAHVAPGFQPAGPVATTGMPGAAPAAGPDWART